MPQQTTEPRQHPGNSREVKARAGTFKTQTARWGQGAAKARRPEELKSVTEGLRTKG